jgi:hypothetical protein
MNEKKTNENGGFDPCTQAVNAIDLVLLGAPPYVFRTGRILLAAVAAAGRPGALGGTAGRETLPAIRASSIVTETKRPYVVGREGLVKLLVRPGNR